MYSYVIRPNNSLAFCALFVLVVLTNRASAQQPPLSPSPTPKALPIRLDQPDWRALASSEIKRLFLNRALVVQADYEPAPGISVKVRYFGGCPPREQFSADGRWVMQECQRGQRRYQGHWQTERLKDDDWLCVEADDFPKKCRLVWRGVLRDQVVMSPISPSDDPILDGFFNPYRLIDVR